jgi:hypothetical protein
MMFTLRLLQTEDVLIVRRDRDDARVEVRGKPNYTVDYDAADPLHAFLDALDPASVSALFTYQSHSLNPRNTRHDPSRAACVALFEMSACGS